MLKIVDAIVTTLFITMTIAAFITVALLIGGYGLDHLIR